MIIRSLRNTTETNIKDGEEFVGTQERVLSYSNIVINVKSVGAPLQGYAVFSDDGISWSIINNLGSIESTEKYIDKDGNSFFKTIDFTIPVKAEWFRLRLVNDSGKDTEKLMGHTYYTDYDKTTSLVSTSTSSPLDVISTGTTDNLWDNVEIEKGDSSNIINCNGFRTIDIYGTTTDSCTLRVLVSQDNGTNWIKSSYTILANGDFYLHTSVSIKFIKLLVEKGTTTISATIAGKN